MGLIHPKNLDGWRAWQQGTDPIARLRAVRSGGPREAPPTRATLVAVVARPRHLVVVESPNPSSRAALLAVLDHLPDAGLLVPTSLDPAPLGAAGTSTEVDLGGGSSRLAEVETVSAAGHYTGLGGAAYAWSRRRGARFVTVQHGLLTPHAPPLAPGTSLRDALSACLWSGRAALPVAGNLFEVLGASQETSIEFAEDYHAKYGGMFALDVLGTRQIFASEHALVAEMCSSPLWSKKVHDAIDQVR